MHLVVTSSLMALGYEATEINGNCWTIASLKTKQKHLLYHQQMLGKQKILSSKFRFLFPKT